jgi:uncharacterized membrane protein
LTSSAGYDPSTTNVSRLKDVVQRCRISASITEKLHKKFLNKYEDNLFKIIEENRGVSYYELVQLSVLSPTTIWKTLARLRKEGKMESVPVIGRKAKGWRLSEEVKA